MFSSPASQRELEKVQFGSACPPGPQDLSVSPNASLILRHLRVRAGMAGSTELCMLEVWFPRDDILAARHNVAFSERRQFFEQTPSSLSSALLACLDSLTCEKRLCHTCLRTVVLRGLPPWTSRSARVVICQSARGLASLGEGVCLSSPYVLFCLTWNVYRPLGPVDANALYRPSDIWQLSWVLEAEAACPLYALAL